VEDAPIWRILVKDWALTQENRRESVRRLLRREPIASSRSRLFKPRLTWLQESMRRRVFKVSFEIARCKTLTTRSLRFGTAAMIGGVLFLTPLGNVAAQDANSVAQTVLSQATTQIQDMVKSMSQGCSGGSNGVPPVSWGQLQAHSNTAVNALAEAGKALSRADQKGALNQINIAEGELDALLNGVRGNCSGGSHGVDPIGMSAYLATKASVQGRLDTVKIFLGG
jgi:hypothetical protein